MLLSGTSSPRPSSLPHVAVDAGPRRWGARPGLKEAAAHSLLSLSDDLAAHQECWDIDRDAAHELERLLPTPRLDTQIDQWWLELLDGAERARFAANVRKGIAVLDHTCH